MRLNVVINFVTMAQDACLRADHRRHIQPRSGFDRTGARRIQIPQSVQQSAGLDPARLSYHASYAFSQIHCVHL